MRCDECDAMGAKSASTTAAMEVVEVDGDGGTTKPRSNEARADSDNSTHYSSSSFASSASHHFTPRHTRNGHRTKNEEHS